MRKNVKFINTLYRPIKQELEANRLLQAEHRYAYWKVLNNRKLDKYEKVISIVNIHKQNRNKLKLV